MAVLKTPFAELYKAGDAWLAGCSPHPDLAHVAWGEGTLAPIPTGGTWLAAETRLAAATYALYRIPEEHRGPVLADPLKDKAWWLVPLSAYRDLADVRQVTVHAPPWSLRCPPTGWQLDGRFWLRRPDGSGRLTDPAVLGAAFGPGGRPPMEGRG
ncbi:hypothetical protein [Streptomyces griseosporeus]|uniref:hypothetical protein n=1 Tax=Streptomyces griseosporeus TaxID=1910 RepID=UPI0036F7E9C9